MRDRHLDCICSIGELGSLLRESASLDVFLQRTVELIAEHIGADVCSIYLYNEESDLLILTATHGLAADAVGKVFLRPGEGLVGIALKEMRPLLEGDGTRNPHFRFFPGIGEESFPAIMVLPMLRGVFRIGVVTVQHRKSDHYSQEDLTALRIITSQLAAAIENARLLLQVRGDAEHAVRPVPETRSGYLPRTIRALVGAEGYACGEAVVLDRAGIHEFLDREAFSRHFTPDEYRAALARTEAQLEGFQQALEEKLADVAALLFSAHLLMLRDPEFTGKIEAQIGSGMNPAVAVARVVHEYSHLFLSMKDAYMREKAQDVEDLGRRLIDNLEAGDAAPADLAGRIVVTRGIYPSDMIRFFSEGAAGVVSIGGGVTSHVSIIARSLEIPLLIADSVELLDLPSGSRLLIDARQGEIHVDPDEAVCSLFLAHPERNAAAETPLPEEGVTSADGVSVQLLANVNLLRDAEYAARIGAHGVGLYRTEFPFLVRSTFPSEEEQYVVYRGLLERFPGRRVVFRTLDVGGDKTLAYYDFEKEPNPFLGLRSIRFSLREKAVFREQLRAILRAGHDRRIAVMFPMIASLDEFAEARGMLEDAARELAEEGIPHLAKPGLGVMVELPAALEILDELAEEVDFFSIGSNDLVQYLLAVDRTNKAVSHLYQPHHPAVLRALARISDAGRRHGIEVSICGDMGRDAAYLAFFLGIGIRRFSVDPHFLGFMRDGIGKIDVPTAEAFASRLLGARRIDEVEGLIADWADRHG